MKVRTRKREKRRAADRAVAAPPSMAVRRRAHTRARQERALRALAWRLGVSPGLLRAVLNRPECREPLRRAA